MDTNCFICKPVPEAPKVLSANGGPTRRAMDLFIVLQRALDLPDLGGAAQSEIVQQISFCKSCLDELEVTKSMVDAFDKMKQIADRHMCEIKSKFLESRRHEIVAKSTKDQEVDGHDDITELRSQMVAAVQSSSNSTTVSAEAPAIFKRVTRTRTKPNKFRGPANPSTTQRMSAKLLEIGSIPTASTKMRSVDQLEMNVTDGASNILNENGHEASANTLPESYGQENAKAGRSGMKKMKVSEEPGSLTQHFGREKKMQKFTSIPRHKPRTEARTKQAKSNEKKFKCQQCPAKFNHKCSLTSHLRIHTGVKPFSCPFCPKTFVRNGDLRRHQVSHTGERLHLCTYCSKKFGRRDHLKEHERIHTGEKPYLCNLCSKSFPNSGTLVTHMRTHTREKPYLCKMCSKTFTTSSNLGTHMRSHTGEKPYKCSTCSKEFSTSSHLTRHQKMHSVTE